MAAESLTYAQIAERLGVSPEAARSLARRHRLPRAPGNDGKVHILIDLAEIAHKPATARAPAGDQPAAELIATALKDRVAFLETELLASEQRAAGHRADFEHERDRADRLMAIHDQMVAELKAVRELLEVAQAVAQAVPTRPRPWWRRWRKSA
jgi:hypothetical protein